MSGLRSPMAAGLNRLTARFRALPARARDVVLASVVAVLSFTPGLADKGTSLGWLGPQRTFDLLAVLLILGLCAPLLGRSRAPALCLLLVSAAFFAYQCLGYRASLATIALYIALYGAGAHQVRHRLVTVAAWTLGYAALSGCLIALGAPASPVEHANFFVLPAGCWLLGTWTRTRLREQVHRQNQDLEVAMQAEREHIARELHDVVTHHVTAIVMQADALLYVPPENRQKIETGLSAVGRTGRHALADLRELLGVLSPGHDTGSAPRTPRTGEFGDLVDQIRLAGQPVEFVQDSPAASLNGLAGLTAFRVVQEALTNALKHAPGRRTTVRISAQVPNQVRIEVRTDGTGDTDTASEPPVSGRGLAGLNRRVALAGGKLSTRQDPDGSFVLRATLPTRPDAG